MDFQGQRLCEQVSWWGLVALAVITFVIGFVCSDFVLMAKLFGGGALALGLVVLPDHPWYPPSLLFNRNLLPWLPALEPEEAMVEPTTVDRLLSVVGLGSSQSKVVKKAPPAAAALQSKAGREGGRKGKYIRNS